jgi:muconolactone delta-isomerase
MEFLAGFEVEVPAGTPDAEVDQHQRAESAAAAKLAEDGHLVRLWRRPLAGDGTTAIGLYHADSEAALDGLLAALPPPAGCVSRSRRSRRTQRPGDGLSMSARLPDPSPTRVYRLEATRGEPLDLGDLAQGRRRIVPLTGGTFTGPELNGEAAPRARAPTGRPSSPTEPPSATSATRSRPTRAICSMSNHGACATAAPTCSWPCRSGLA